MSKAAISLVVLITIFGGACAIGIVWLRMDISEVAARCGVLRTRGKCCHVKYRNCGGSVPGLLRPSTLASMVEGRLSMPGPRQTYHVSESDMKKRLGGYKRSHVVAANNGGRGNYSDGVR